jgi:hypothetical protein
MPTNVNVASRRFLDGTVEWTEYVVPLSAEEITGLKDGMTQSWFTADDDTTILVYSQRPNFTTADVAIDLRPDWIAALIEQGSVSFDRPLARRIVLKVAS